MTSFQSRSVHACPSCGTFFLRHRLATINFFGTKDWSDGMPTAWWKKEPLLRCDHCAALFWFDHVALAGILPRQPRPMRGLTRIWMRWRGDPQGRLRDEAEWRHAPASWKSAQYIGHVNVQDAAYVLANDKGLCRDKLLWLRKRIWWSLNDRYRSLADISPMPDVSTEPEVDERANMQAILDLLKDGEMQSRDLIEAGELLRLLGRFDEAVDMLKRVLPDGHNEIRAVKIEKLARSGDTQVQLLSQHVL